MMTKKLNDVYYELSYMAEREAYKLWRLAWRAKDHGCSEKLVNEIKDEAWQLYNGYKSNPGQLLDWRTKSELKYAFCGERMKHTYLVVNAETGEARMERR